MSNPAVSEFSEVFSKTQQLIQAGHVPEALATLNQLPPQGRETVSALYMYGVCYRHLKDFSNAETSLRMLLEQSPAHGRAF